jgi:uncharacterized protein YecT (DUF1311 family)
MPVWRIAECSVIFRESTPMRVVFLSAALLFITATAVYAEAARGPNDTAKPTETQTEMNRKACAETKQADEALKEIYSQVLKKYGYDKVFVTNMAASQKAWLAYRDAHIKAYYPPEYRPYAGSITPLCVCQHMARMANERIKELKQWIDGVSENNICAGSIMRIRPAQVKSR